MIRLTGRVLVKETNQGVPSLLVVAYDASTDANLDGLKAAAARHGSDAFGRRLASVVTDDQGAFSMARADLTAPGHEARPNLLLGVFAPEDVQSTSRPYPLPPEKRILYLSAVPRTNAAAEEAFVIRLLQEQLAQFGICQAAGASSSDVSVSRLHSAASEVFSLRDGFQERLGPQLRREQARVDRTRKAAADKVKGLSGIPLHLRDGALQNNRFLLTHRNELATRLKTVQDAAITDGLKRVRKVGSTLRLRLSAQDLRDLGLAAGKTHAGRKVDQRKLQAKAKELLAGPDLRRLSAPSNALADLLEAKYLAPVATTTPTATTEKKPPRRRSSSKSTGRSSGK